MCKKLFLLLLVGLLSSAYAVDIVDPILSDDISPTSIYSSVGNPEIWSIARSIDGSLTTNFGWQDEGFPFLTQTIIFDLGSKKSIGAFKWWNRATSGDLFGDNIDLYKFTNDDPTDTPILLDMDLYTDSRQTVEANRDNDDIVADVIDITDFYGRYVMLVMDDGPQNGGTSVQGSEIAFRVPEPATMLLLGLGGLALIRKKR
jgi:hypothetical protein